MFRYAPLLAALALVPAVAAAPVRRPSSLALPDGSGGIGFDDLVFSPALHRVLVPAGRTGLLDLVDPATRHVTAIPGFTATATFARGHGQGTTSADFGAGFLFASDRDRSEVIVIDATTASVVSHAKLAASPDYVRWIAPLGEVWVTEPDATQIERFALDHRALASRGTIAIANGPESLVVDAARGRAYTHTWTDETVVIDLKQHRVVARWKNGCAASRGIALDEARGLLFVGCEAGKATALDVAHGGKQVGSVETGTGVDIIAYNPTLAHLYVPGGDSATLTIAGVAPTGRLTWLASVPVAADSHCVAADDANHAYVCDPDAGALLVVTDPFPASK